MDCRYLLAIAASITFLTSCNNAAPEPVALTPQQQINANIDTLKTWAADGDLLVRLNDDMLSEMIKQLAERDRSFSHAGIIVSRNNKKMVCHIYPNERAGADTILYEPLDSFINPEKNLSCALFRYNLSTAEKNAFIGRLDSFSKQEVHFDKTFDLGNDTALYCSEMIAKSLQAATNNRITCKQIHIPKKMIPLLLRYFARYKPTYKQIEQTPFIAIEDLYLLPSCKEIIRTKLKYIP